jgi:hypothetical protein
MQIEFVGHSSVVFRDGPVHLLCDPWLTGAIFDDGWGLLSEPVFGADDFSSITHIWYSHEHPDHFSPKTLEMIPADVRKRITVLFHHSKDRKIIRHCSQLGFAAVQELPLAQWVNLAPGFDLLCDTWEGSDDSWLLVRTPEMKILDLNDCQINSRAQAESVHQQAGDVDILLTQFSISAWDGNPEDLPRRQAGADAMLRRTVMQTQILRARHVIPFASFVWFCHEENGFMNECLTDVGLVEATLREQTDAQPVILYPGDRWEAGASIDSSSAIARYRADVATLPGRPRTKSEPVELDDLFAAAEKFARRLQADQPPWKLRLRAVKSHLRHLRRQHADAPLYGAMRSLWALITLRSRPARIWLTDHRTSLEYGLDTGLRASGRTREDCDIELSSSALHYALKFLWGGESLHINGRFREIYPDGRRILFEHLWTACSLNHEEGAPAGGL